MGATSLVNVICPFGVCGACAKAAVTTARMRRTIIGTSLRQGNDSMQRENGEQICERLPS